MKNTHRNLFSLLNNNFSNDFDSGSKNSFDCSKMRKFFKTNNENSIPISICCLSKSPFFTIHKQFLAHLYDSINKKSVMNNRKGRISQISHCFTPEGAEDLYWTEFLISLFFHHLKIDESYGAAHIILERRKKAEMPLFLPTKDSWSDVNPMNSVASMRDSVNFQNPEAPSKIVLTKQQMLSYFNSQLSFLTIENLDYHILFKNIRPARLIVLIEAMLLEK